jgi:hypothetical protein
VVASEDKNEKNFHYIYVMRKMVDKEKQWERNHYSDYYLS